MNYPDKIDEQIYKAINLFNNDNYKEAEDLINFLLKNTDFKNLSELQLNQIANIYLSLGKFNAAEDIYRKVCNSAAQAFCLIFLKDLQKAFSLLKTADHSQLSNWCHFLIEIFLGGKENKFPPSFLAIRHFLENTVYLFLKSKNENYLNILLSKVDFLSKYNLDSEKYISCSYYQVKDFDNAIKILQNASKRNSHDPEIYFTLGKIYYEKKMFTEALLSLENVKLLFPEHRPTLAIIKKIETELSGS